jgi:hypothetical protein
MKWKEMWQTKIYNLLDVDIWWMTFNPTNKDFWAFCVKHVDGLTVRDYETEVASSYVLDLQHS